MFVVTLFKCLWKRDRRTRKGFAQLVTNSPFLAAELESFQKSDSILTRHVDGVDPDLECLFKFEQSLLLTVQKDPGERGELLRLDLKIGPLPEEGPESPWCPIEFTMLPAVHLRQSNSSFT